MALTKILLIVTLISLSLALTSSASAIGTSESTYGYGPKPDDEKPKIDAKNLHLRTICVQGLIYCKTPASKLIPLEGAVARITCQVVDEYGNEAAPFSILSDATDKKGFFFATFSPSELEERMRLTECKAFLEDSPLLETCNIPSDVNGGITGAPLLNHRLFPKKKKILYSVGPFVYESEPNPDPVPVPVPIGY